VRLLLRPPLSGPGNGLLSTGKKRTFADCGYPREPPSSDTFLSLSSAHTAVVGGPTATHSTPTTNKKRPFARTSLHTPGSSHYPDCFCPCMTGSYPDLLPNVIPKDSNAKPSTTYVSGSGTPVHSHPTRYLSSVRTAVVTKIIPTSSQSGDPWQRHRSHVTTKALYPIERNGIRMPSQRRGGLCRTTTDGPPATHKVDTRLSGHSGGRTRN